MSTEKLLYLLVFLLLMLMVAGCQLPLANYFRDNLFPKSTEAKIAMSPLLFPTYAVFSVTDVALINPIRGTVNVPSTTQAVWGWQGENPWLGYLALLPVKVVAIPVTAIGTVMFSEQFVYQNVSD